MTDDLTHIRLRKLTFSNVQRFTVSYTFRLGTDLDIPLYGSPLKPITISFQASKNIPTRSNKIKPLVFPNRHLCLIHFCWSRTHFSQKRIPREKKKISEKEKVSRNKKKTPAAVAVLLLREKLKNQKK